MVRLQGQSEGQTALKLCVNNMITFLLFQHSGPSHDIIVLSQVPTRYCTRLEISLKCCNHSDEKSINSLAKGWPFRKTVRVRCRISFAHTRIYSR
jgi:hypothetical protein